MVVEWSDVDEVDFDGGGGVSGSRGEKGEGGMERRVGQKGVGWIRIWVVRV
jgi:hypothetical protein